MNLNSSVNKTNNLENCIKNRLEEDIKQSKTKSSLSILKFSKMVKILLKIIKIKTLHQKILSKYF